MSLSPGSPCVPTAEDWHGLARLFADDQAAFRHRLGVFRNDTHSFYAATAQASSIRAEKDAILQSPDGDQYLVETNNGVASFHEFTRHLGLPLPEPDEKSGMNALNRAATLALEPDWMLMAPPDWRLVWASVCFPTRWSLTGKAELPLPEIHGAVPGLNEELGRKIGVYFGRLVPGEGWSRANWGLSPTAQLNQHPSLPFTMLSERTPDESVYVRVESQHLLKLPETGSIAFGIRILNFPLPEVRRRAEINAALKWQLRTMPAEVAAYKAIPPDFWRRL